MAIAPAAATITVSPAPPGAAASSTRRIFMRGIAGILGINARSKFEAPALRTSIGSSSVNTMPIPQTRFLHIGPGPDPVDHQSAVVTAGKTRHLNLARRVDLNIGDDRA
ncbi:MAG: hypothetical protein R3E68_01665 [Burkholderiaceae bacterium]